MLWLFCCIPWLRYDALRQLMMQTVWKMAKFNRRLNMMVLSCGKWPLERKQRSWLSLACRIVTVSWDSFDFECWQGRRCLRGGQRQRGSSVNDLRVNSPKQRSSLTESKWKGNPNAGHSEYFHLLRNRSSQQCSTSKSIKHENWNRNRPKTEKKKTKK